MKVVRFILFPFPPPHLVRLMRTARVDGAHGIYVTNLAYFSSANLTGVRLRAAICARARTPFGAAIKPAWRR
jgi:hypothetical protein